MSFNFYPDYISVQWRNCKSEILSGYFTLPRNILNHIMDFFLIHEQYSLLDGTYLPKWLSSF